MSDFGTASFRSVNLSKIVYLPRIADKLLEDRLVITGGEMAYTRKDGVKIVPIGALGN